MKYQGMMVVVDLCQDLKDNIVTCDQFFASYDSRRVLKGNFTIIDTIRKNKNCTPPGLLVTTENVANTTLQKHQANLLFFKVH